MVRLCAVWSLPRHLPGEASRMNPCSSGGMRVAKGASAEPPRGKVLKWRYSSPSLPRGSGSGLEEHSDFQLNQRPHPERTVSKHCGRAPVNHACNPSYLEGWDREDWGSRRAQANSLRDLHLQNDQSSQVLVAHACNPSYSGGRNQEDRGLKPAWVNSSRDPILKNTYHKKGWWSGSRWRPWF
jgi:hypothetical protein